MVVWIVVSAPPNAGRYYVPNPFAAPEINAPWLTIFINPMFKDFT